MPEFTPIDYDVSKLPLDAEEGLYDARCAEIKVSATANGSFPMLILEWKLEDAVDGSEASVGATVADFMTFFPPTHKAAKMSVGRTRSLLDAAGLDYDLIPTRLTGKESFRDLIDELEGKKLTLRIKHETDKKSGEVRCKVIYPKKTAKKGSKG